MQHVIIQINVKYSDGKPAKLEEMDAKELKQLRFRLLVEAGKIKNRIFELTGKDVDDDTQNF